MPIELCPDRNVLEIEDARSGTMLEVYYRNPTNAESLQWSNTGERQGKKIVITPKTLEKQARLGLAVMTGFREGDLAVQGKPIASDKTSPNYYADWRKLLLAGRQDILRYVAQRAFSPVTNKAADDQVEVVIEDLADQDFAFDGDGTDEATEATPAAATGVTEAVAAENP